MKIGIDISQIVYQTGVSRYTAELTRHLLQLDSEDQFYLFGGSLRQRPIIRAFAADVANKKTQTQLTWLTPRLSDWLWNRLNLFSPDYWCKDLDVFHASNWALPRTRASLVTTIHDLTFIKYPQNLTPALVAAHTRHLQRSRQWAQAIIAVSEATKNDLLAWGFPPEKIKVIYSAAAHQFKPMTKPQLPLVTKPYLLSVATLEPRKNLPRLMAAFKQLRSKYPKLTLALVGKFGWGEAIKSMPGVRLLGFVPDTDLPNLYAQAEAFVYPSLYEGFGLPVLEALSCGCPVVTSDVSSLPEVAGKAAVYVNPKSVESIAKGIKEAFKQANSLRRAGLAQAKKFSWEKTAKETLRVYQEAYANRR